MAETDKCDPFQADSLYGVERLMKILEEEGKTPEQIVEFIEKCGPKKMRPEAVIAYVGGANANRVYAEMFG